MGCPFPERGDSVPNHGEGVWLGSRRVLLSRFSPEKWANSKLMPRGGDWEGI